MKFKMAKVLIALQVIVFYCADCQSVSATAPDSVQFPAVAHQIPIVLRVAGQIGFGALGGSIGSLAGKIHPVIGGVGWTVGSSFGVFAIGDGGTHRGSYLWTLTAGAATLLAWTPAMSKSRGDLETGLLLVGAGLTSLAAEIVVYYITEDEPSDQELTIGITPGTSMGTSVRLPSNMEGCTVSIRLAL
jgi:hypothetical protein